TPSVRLSWESTSRDANRFKIYITADDETLEPVNLGPLVQYLTTTTFTVTGLAERNEVTFMVVAGDTVSFDDVGATVTVTTGIRAPVVDSDSALQNVTATSIVLRWEVGSAFATNYSIEGIILGGGG